MATWTIKNVALRGVTGTVPANQVKTADFPFFTQEEADLFDSTVGIRNRYIATEDVCASDLCKDAAERLIDALGWGKDSIDVLIFASVTGDFKTPPTSAILQDRLGLSSSTFVLDVPMGCCGCMYAITVAGNLLSAGTARRAILLIGDTAMRMGSFHDKSRVPLFGAAMGLEYDQEAQDIVIEFNTFGSGYRALMTPHGGYRHPITKDSFVEEDFGNGIIRAPKDALINGMDVFSFAITKPPISVKKMMEEQGLDKDNDVDGHIDFIYSISTIRAKNYDIETLDIFQTKSISGKIIPALSTTTSSIVGLACIQLYLLVQNNVNSLKCSNINLGVNFYDSSYPEELTYFKDDEKPGPNQLPIKLLSDPFSVWDSIEIKNSLIAKEFISFFEIKYGIYIDFISCNQTKIIEPLLIDNNDPDYNMKIENLYEKNSKIKLDSKRKIL